MGGNAGWRIMVLGRWPCWVGGGGGGGGGWRGSVRLI